MYDVSKGCMIQNFASDVTGAILNCQMCALHHRAMAHIDSVYSLP
jgi:hypothetical protein